MPQPFLKLNPPDDAVFDFTSEAVARQPDLAVKLALAISNWSRIEGEAQLILTSITGASAETIAAIYTALTGAGAQSAVLHAVAEQHLREDDLNLFRALEQITKSPRKQRNAVAHGIWGYSDTIPDGLLLIAPKDALARQAVVGTAWAKFKQDRNMEILADTVKVQGLNREAIMVYKAADFDSINGEITRVYSYWSRFRGLLAMQEFVPNFPEAHAEWRAKLCNEPPIREALERIRKARQIGS